MCFVVWSGGGGGCGEEDEQEELDFMFDEELEKLGDGGRKNQFTEYW